jgi:regulatory protein
MAIITKITVQKKLKDRYNIFLDDGSGEKYAFSVDEEVLIKYKLKKGMELDEFSITEVFFHDDIRKAYHLAVQYLALRMRSEFEIRQYLQKKEIADPIINEVIHKLYHHQFLNDEEFSVAFVRTQMNTTDKGIALIRRELKEKGISDSLIDGALIHYPLDEQIEKASVLANKYYLKNGKDSARVVKQKLEQLLLRKGYSYEIIQDVISRITIDKNQEEEMDVLKAQGEKIVRKYQKLSGYEFKQKVKQALYQKGFALELIDQFLSELQTEE